jgi:hypothetical protein
MRTRTIARWRRAVLGSALAVTVAVPGRARAQQDQQQAPAKQEAAPDQAAQTQPAADQAQPEGPRENAPITGQQKPPAEGNAEPVPGSPDEYTIQKGDTLWDLSQKFLNNPWYWPKIWSMNPTIENPHWIYPGNKLRIVPGEGGAQAPAQVQEDQQGIDATARNAEEPQSGASPDVSVTPPATPDLDVITRNSRGGDNSVSATGKLAFEPSAVATIRNSGMVTPEELQAAGSLESSFEERELLATYDTAYARYHGAAPVKPGDKLVIFRTEGDIVHPVTHKTLGRQTRSVGVAKVLSVQGDQATMQIERTFEEIERGDRVRQWTAPDRRVSPRPNTADVEGHIVQAVESGLTTYAEANQVFIDRGSADGVQEGNTFAIVRKGDGLNERSVTDVYVSTPAAQRALGLSTPDESVGLLMVVDAREHLSTAVIVKSIRELQPGDRVAMHTSGGGSGTQ